MPWQTLHEKFNILLKLPSWIKYCSKGVAFAATTDLPLKTSTRHVGQSWQGRKKYILGYFSTCFLDFNKEKPESLPEDCDLGRLSLKYVVLKFRFVLARALKDHPYMILFISWKLNILLVNLHTKPIDFSVSLIWSSLEPMLENSISYSWQYD